MKDGDVVKAGDILIELDTIVATANLAMSPRGGTRRLLAAPGCGPNGRRPVGDVSRRADRPIQRSGPCRNDFHRGQRHSNCGARRESGQKDSCARRVDELEEQLRAFAPSDPRLSGRSC